MKALQLGLDWFPERAGGLPRYFFDLMNAAPEAGITARGLVAGSENVAKDSGGQVRAFAPISTSLPGRLFAARKAVGEELTRFDPDLVASHFALYTLPALDRIKHPIAVHFHGPWASESAVEGHGGLRHRTKMALESAVYNRASRFIVLSHAFRSVLIDSFHVSPDAIRVIPGGVDIDRFDISASQTEARDHLGWPQDRWIILAVRRLARRMGLDNLVDAIAQLTTKHPEVLLHIGGRGAMADELARMIADRGLENHVKLLGFISNEDLPIAYRAADVSVVPTVALEGFGLIAAESLAAGTPVLVTPVGGLPEVVTELDPSLVLEGGTAGQIAHAFEDVLSGRHALPGAADCTSYVRRRFSWPRIMAQIKTVYAEAINAG